MKTEFSLKIDTFQIIDYYIYSAYNNIIMKEYFLQMKNIYKYFMKTPVLKDVSFNVKKGTVHALVGENGAGKSTLMKCIFGIYKIDKGEIFINGTKVNISTPNEALKHGIIMVNQELETMDNRSIAENIFCNRYPINL